MHLVTSSALARLKANKNAYEHFERKRPLYLKIAKDADEFCAKYPELQKDETRVSLVAKSIYEIDTGIFALKTNDMSAKEIADTFARMVVGHAT